MFDYDNPNKAQKLSKEMVSIEEDRIRKAEIEKTGYSEMTSIDNNQILNAAIELGLIEK